MLCAVIQDRLPCNDGMKKGTTESLFLEGFLQLCLQLAGPNPARQGATKPRSYALPPVLLNVGESLSQPQRAYSSGWA